MIESLQLSRRLEECVTELLVQAEFCESSLPKAAKLYRQWAADIRSVIVPQPGERDPWESGELGRSLEHARVVDDGK